MPLKAWKDYANLTPAVESVAQRRPSESASVRFDADDKALYVVAKLDGMNLPDLGDQAALQAKLYVDARPGSEVAAISAWSSRSWSTRGRPMVRATRRRWSWAASATATT